MKNNEEVKYSEEEFLQKTINMIDYDIRLLRVRTHTTPLTRATRKRENLSMSEDYRKGQIDMLTNMKKELQKRLNNIN